MKFFFVALVWCLVFFSLAGCKRAGYVLPAFPALALILGCYVDALLPQDGVVTLRSSKARGLAGLAHRATLLVLGLAFGCSVAAMVAGLHKPAHGLAGAALAGAGFGYLAYRGPERRWPAGWALCGSATFLVMLAALHQVLPRYAGRFSLRAQVLRQLQIGCDRKVPVVCYPRRWDSVSFYLQRSDVRVYSRNQRAEFFADLQMQPATLVFVKSGLPLDELLRDWPESLELAPRGQGNVWAFLVSQRQGYPTGELASRQKTGEINSR